MPFDSEPAIEVTTRDRLIRLRDFLAGLPKFQFNMATYALNECGTPACIAGWAGRIFSTRITQAEGYEILGLNEEQAWDLFLPGNQLNLIGRFYNEITLGHAVKVLDHLIETGEVDWHVAFA